MPPSNKLPWTGERYVPQIRGTIALEHLHRYAYACEYVLGKVVLDIASGEGYGSEMLSRTAHHVYGVDIDATSITHAKLKYNSAKLTFREGCCTEIPLEDASVDVVVSLETIEHITEHVRMMSEVKRVLRPGGILIISSPERHEYSELNKQQNPYHLKELNQDEFISLLEKHFKHTSFFGQRVIYGSALVEMGKPSGAAKTYKFDELPQRIEAANGLSRPTYIIVVCCDHPIQVASGGICEQDISQSDTVLAYQQIVTEKEGVIAEMCREILVLREAVGNRNDQSSGLQSYIAEKENLIAQADHVDLLKSCWSWRLTAPLRAAHEKVISVVRSAKRYRLAAWIMWTHRKTGIFDPEWYLDNNPDVRESGMNPWWHFAMHGVYERRDSKGSFSFEEYLLMNEEVSTSELNPVMHYVLRGWKEIRLIDCKEGFYKKNNAEVIESEKGLKKHYTKYRRIEGRLHPKIDLDRNKAKYSISVVLPTYNRADKLEKVIDSIVSCGEGLNYEIIVVNDGSIDNTKAVLQDLKKKYPEVRVINIANQGAGIARNHGAKAAQNDIILFVGDDIIPANKHFLLAHILYHQESPRVNFSVLGKVDWPSDEDFEITPVMRHIQGPGGEQFGYTDMQPYRCWDWRFFYTCNVSVKKNVVSDWINDGFSSKFTGCGFEDGEFACRMEKKHGRFTIFYIEESLGYHFHRHNVESFLRRQRHAGAMGYTMFKLHPESLHKAGFSEVHRMLNSLDFKNPQIIPEALDRVDSLFKQAIELEKKNLLGNNTWHKELLHSIFKISFYLGFIEQSTTPLSNYSKALEYITRNAYKNT